MNTTNIITRSIKIPVIIIEQCLKFLFLWIFTIISTYMYIYIGNRQWNKHII